MAPSAATSAQHRPRSNFGAADAASMVVTATSVSTAYQHQHHQRRAGAPVFAYSIASSGIDNPPVGVRRHRRTYSTSSAQVAPSQIFDGRNEKMRFLSRSLSGSKLNAEAPAFVPKGLQIVFSTPLPVSERPHGLGLSLPSQVQVPSSVVPVINPATSVANDSVSEVFVPTVGESIAECVQSSGDIKDTDGPDGMLALEHTGDSEQSQATAATLTQPTKPKVTEGVKAKIVSQVELCFSDTNLLTDNYLMKFVKKDPEGFVPIPVVATLRKVKSLVKNHEVVATALRSSSLLVVSEDGKRVRRAHPLPEVNPEEGQSRTVVAENLPENPSIGSVQELFEKVGKVKKVRICSPEIPNGAISASAKHPKTDLLISNKLHALVEFETVELAEKAVVALTNERNWRSGLRVRMLQRRAFQGKHNYQQAPHQRTRKPSMDNVDLTMEEEEGEKPEKNGDKPHDKGGEEVAVHQHHADRGEDITSHGESGDQVGKKGRGRGRGGRTGGGGRGRGQQFYSTHSGTPPRDNSVHAVSELVGKPPPGPRMPDGTRGFSTGRGKTLVVNSAANSVA